MLTDTERITADIAKTKAELANIDRDIEGRERRLSDIRQYRETKWRLTLTLEAQLERETAPSAQRQGKCDTVRDAHGVVWQV